MFKTKHSAKDRAQQGERSPFRLLIWGALALLLIPLAAFIFLHLPWVQQRVIRQAIQGIEAAAGVQIELGSYRWSPFSHIRLDSLRVTSDQKELLQCEHAQLSYRLSWDWPYLVPKVLSLSRPVLHLEKDGHGKWRIPRTGTQRASSSLADEQYRNWTNIPLPEVKIESGRVVAMQAGQVVLSLQNVSGTLSFKLLPGDDGPTLQIDFGQWQGRAEVPQWGDFNTEGELSLNDQLLTVDRLNVAIGDKSRIECEGSVHLAAPFDTELSVRLQPLLWSSFPELQQIGSGLQEISGTLQVVGRDGGWTIAHELKSNLGDLSGTLQLAGQGEQTSLQWTTRFAELRVPAFPPLPQSTLNGQAELALQGRHMERMQGELKGTLKSSKWGEHTIHHAEIEGSYSGGKLDLRLSDAATSAGSFCLSAAADLIGIWDVAHAGGMRLDLSVKQADLKGLVAGVHKDVSGSASLEVSYGAGRLQEWKKWQAKAKSDMNIPGLGCVKLFGTYASEMLDLDYDLRLDDLTKISLVYPWWDGKGRISSQGKLKGGWPDLLWQGQVDCRQLEYGPLRAEHASLQGKGRVTGKEAQRALSVRAENVRYEGQGVGAVALELEQKNTGCSYRLQGDRIARHGACSLSGEVQNIWSPSRTLVIQKGSLGWKGLSAQVDGKMSCDPKQVVVHSFNLHSGSQRVDLKGTVSWTEDLDMKIAWTQLNAPEWLQPLGFNQLRSGAASGEMRLTGRPDKPQATFQVRVNKAALQGNDALIDTVQLNGTYADETLQLAGELSSSTFSKAPIRISGSLPLHFSVQPPSLEVKARDSLAATVNVTELDIHPILPYVTDLDKLGGAMTAEVNVSGTASAPVVKAAGSCPNGFFQIHGWPHLISKVKMQWQADAKQILITQSEMEHLGGHVSVTGTTSYPKFDHVDLEAYGRGLVFPGFFGIDGKVDGRLRLQETPGAPVLTGEFKFSKAQMNLEKLETDLARNIELIEGEEKGQLVEIRGGEKEQNNYYNQMRIDVNFELPGAGTWVRGNGLEAEIHGSLRIQKKPFAPVALFGRLETIRGTYTFQNRELKIVDGSLVFLGTPNPDPNLKITCEKDVAEAVVQVAVAGPLSGPKLNLSSIPSMNRVDIISYILFDQPAGQLSSKESAQLQDRAMSLFGSQASKVLKSALGDHALAPDVLRYRDDADGEGGVVEIGKKITPDLSVTYQKGVMGSDSNHVQLEYRLNRNLSVQTQVGPSEQNGVDFLWRYDFGK